MKTVYEKSVLQKIQTVAQEAEARKVVVEEILLTPEEIAELKREIMIMLPKGYWTNQELPIGLKLFGVPVRAQEVQSIVVIDGTADNN